MRSYVILLGTVVVLGLLLVGGYYYGKGLITQEEVGPKGPLVAEEGLLVTAEELGIREVQPAEQLHLGESGAVQNASIFWLVVRQVDEDEVEVDGQPVERARVTATFADIPEGKPLVFELVDTIDCGGCEGKEAMPVGVGDLGLIGGDRIGVVFSFLPDSVKNFV